MVVVRLMAEPPASAPFGFRLKPQEGMWRGDRVVNALSVDVEDWFQVQALADVIDRASWDRLPTRVARTTA